MSSHRLRCRAPSISPSQQPKHISLRIMTFEIPAVQPHISTYGVGINLPLRDNESRPTGMIKRWFIQTYVYASNGHPVGR